MSGLYWRGTYLQTEDVGTVLANLFHDGFLAVVPHERPLRTVGVELMRAVAITQHVVAHHSEDRWKHTDNAHDTSSPRCQAEQLV